MDKQLIERIALEALDSFKSEDNDPEQTDRESVAEFAAHFLARIDAERGKDAVAWLHESRREADVITTAVKNVWGGVAVGNMAAYSIPLFLSPTIPPNMALVPKVATEEMVAKGAHALSEWLDDAAPLHERRYLDPAKSAWADMLAAVQGERNAE